MKYKAIFFDRDGTLTYFDKEKELWRDQIISQWSGKPFELPYDKMMHLFNLASQGKIPWYKTSNSYIAVVSLNLYGGCACRL